MATRQWREMPKVCSLKKPRRDARESGPASYDNPIWPEARRENMVHYCSMESQCKHYKKKPESCGSAAVPLLEIVSKMKTSIAKSFREASLGDHFLNVKANLIRTVDMHEQKIAKQAADK